MRVLILGTGESKCDHAHTAVYHECARDLVVLFKAPIAHQCAFLFWARESPGATMRILPFIMNAHAT